MSALEKAKIKHWNELVTQANHILTLWRKFCEGPHPRDGYSGYVVGEEYLIEMDELLGEGLLSHLSAEFPEDFQGVKKFTDLLSLDIPNGAISKLRLIAQRRTFDGTFCQVCKAWQESFPASKQIFTSPIIAAYLESHKNNGSSKNTLSLYGSLLTRFAETFRILPTEPEPIEQFLGQFPHDTTRYDYYKILRWFYKWAGSRYSIPNPTDKMRAPKVKKKVVPSLSRKELEKVIRQSYTKRDRAIILLLSGCGLRVSEAVNLKFRDVFDDVLIIKDAEGVKTGGRNVPLGPEIRKALLDLKDGHDASDAIFWGTHPTQPLKQAGFAGVVKKAFQDAGIEGKRPSPHTLRHTFARNWITQGGDVASLQRILGHENLETTQRYFALGIEELVNKNQKHNPLSDMLDQRLSTDDDRLSTLDHNISQW